MDHEREHLRRLAAYQRQIERIFDAALRDAARLGLNCDAADMEQLFAIGDHPEVKRQFERLLKKVADNIEAVVADGVTAEWQLANDKNDALALQLLGQAAKHLTDEQRRRYFNNHEAAREAFLKRKEAGLNLSDNVWRYTNQFKEEIEMGLDCGLRDGLTAPEMARQLKQYLQHPDALFRRVRDEHGLLQLSRRAKAYHPGQGVYRSAYMNARRLAATETNIAYRTADHDRQQDLDFVVGIEVHLSTNHTVKLQAGEKPDPNDPLYNDPKRRAQSLRADGTPKAGAVRTLHDICDELAGRYPKTFKFTGWHPHCRCYTTTILKTPEEIADDNRRLMRGEEPAKGSENEVRDLPQRFKDWVTANRERIDGAKQLPYFIRDNQRLINSTTKPQAPPQPKPARTQQQADDIKRRYWQRWEPAGLTQEQKAANIEAYLQIERDLGVKRGRPMTHDAADHLRGNPHFAYGTPYARNCQTCCPVYELRRRGFDIEALPNTKGSALETLSYHTETAWQGATKTTIKATTREKLLRQLEDHANGLPEGARLHIDWTWSRRRSGHIITLERTSEGLRYYDPQTGRHITDPMGYLVSRLSLNRGIKVLRVDTLAPDPAVIRGVATKTGGKATAGKAGKAAGATGAQKQYKKQKSTLHSDKFKVIKNEQRLNNIKSGRLFHSANSRKSLIKHAHTNEALEAAEYAWNNPHELKFKRKSPLGEGKNTKDPKDAANIKAKQRRGVKNYNIYEITYKGKTWKVGLEEYKSGFEKFYFIE